MASMIIFLSWLAIFLFITLVMVFFVTQSYSDFSALYKIYAVRDRLIHSVVFEGVDRNDDFFDALYSNVNDLLSASRAISGAKAWPKAIVAGKNLAGHKSKPTSTNPFIPENETPPAVLVPVIRELDTALKYMLMNHFGFHLLFSAKTREQRKLQRQKAKDLRNMISKCEHCNA